MVAPEAPNAGKAYPVDVHWTYQRFTTGKTYEYAVGETQTNVHVADDVEVETPHGPRVQSDLGEIEIQASYKACPLPEPISTRSRCSAPQALTSSCTSPTTVSATITTPTTASTQAALNLESARKLLKAQNDDVHGVWRVLVFAQDVNHTKPGTPPEIAAQQIGGIFVASAIELTFDPSLPCPLKSHGTITVV